MEKLKNCWLIGDRPLFFSSTFCHSGGSNYTIDQTGYVYQLFAYIVLSESDYPSVV